MNPSVEATVDFAALTERARKRAVFRRKSPYHGVRWKARTQRWRACVTHKGRSYERTFREAEDAARWYDVVIGLLKGWKPKNFDGKAPQGMPKREIRAWLRKRGLSTR